MLSTGDPLAISVTNTIDVLCAISRTISKIFEIFENQKNQHYDFFMRSQALSSALLSMIAFVSDSNSVCSIEKDGNPGQGQQLIISTTGLEKVDLALNQMKKNAIFSYVLVLKYAH